MATKTGPRPFAVPNTPPRRGSLWGKLWWILIVAFFLVIVLPAILAEMITDWMWFGSQGLAEVYTTRLWLGVGVFFGASILSALLLYLNWRLAWSFARRPAEFEGQQESIPPRLVRWIILGAAAIIGLFFGLSMADEWPTILLYLNSVPFAQTDPIFNNDIGFYVFGLPLFRLLRGWLVALVVISAIGTAIIYAVGAVPQLGRRLADMQRRATLPGQRPSSGADGAFSMLDAFDGRAGAHLSVLVALFLGLIGFGYWLDRYDLLYASGGVAYGAGYTDVNARLPAYNIMMFVAAIMAVLLLVNIRFRTWKLLAGAVGVWLLAFVLVGGVYPWFVQQFQVKPSESRLETPYIEHNIAATRQAYGLDKFSEREVPAVQSITPQQVRENSNLVRNIRLWDYRPLQDTFRQLQVIRPYYTFNEPDIDRYTINGRLQQVMLSAREINIAGLGAQQATWENQHFRYTHGYGAVVSPVNEIVGEGLPRLLVRDIPPVTDVPELRMDRPEIYYGEATDEYVFVNSQAIEEFDYPSGDDNVTTRYQGEGGVAVSDFFTRLLFAVRFGDGNIMLTPYITEGTRVLFHRNIQNMVRTLAPFLAYDGDPYVVIADGKLYWIQDAYSYTDRYPYSTPDSGINYIRNSVKVVIDTYNGNAVFYVSDPTDPIVQAYRGIFPQLFSDIERMPESLRSHLRYPEDLINIQARVYSTYHMTNPVVFYSKEDVWAIPQGPEDTSIVPPEAYYVNMQLPNDPKEGFMIIQPFTPRGRDNMIAWMAAKSDGEDYGEVEVIRYPKQQLIYGPRQIEARIDQDPIISQQLTLWRSSGSQVVRGNLLTVPISNTVLYAEPLFLQATTGRFPELKRVIVATGDSVGIGADLNSALEVAFKLRPGEIVGADGGGQPSGTPVPGATPPPGGTPSVRSPSEITASALEHYNRAQQALQENDWATYGREQELMKRDLDELARTYGVVTPTIPAGPTPPPSTPSP